MSSGRTSLLCFWAVTALLGNSGCRSIGPGSIPRDRTDYSESIAESWKQQTLRNIVKLRYSDTPIFLDVAQIVNGYTLETGVSINGQFSPASMRGDTFAGAGAHGTFTDRPTITYTPLTGQKFLRSMVDPVPPTTIFYLVQAGYSSEMILEMSLDSLNGVRNRSTRPSNTRSQSPEFQRLLPLIQKLQDAGALGLRMSSDPTNAPAGVFFFRRDHLDDETLAGIGEVKKILALPEDQDRFTLVYSPVRATAQELAVGSRSIIQMMAALSLCVDIPPEDLEQKRASAIPANQDDASPLMRIHSGASRPTDAFAAIHYRNHWFWVDDRDLRSKRVFSSILFLFTLSEGNPKDQLPLLTIPAG